MKRVVKKTIATVISLAMLLTTMLNGNVVPVFAGLISSDTADISFDVLADTEYDDGGVDNAGFFFMKGGKFGEEVGEDAVLVVMDENGNKTEIASKSDEGRKFTKAVKAVSGEFYNMVVLHNESKCALVRTNGSYFGGKETYYDYVVPISDDIVLVGTDTGETVTSGTGSSEKVYRLFDYKLVTETGKEIYIGTDKEKSNRGSWVINIVGSRTIITKRSESVSIIYDKSTDMLIHAEGKAVATGGNYYTVTKENEVTVYDGSGNLIMALPQGYTDINTSSFDTDGYAVISKQNANDTGYSSKTNNIIRKDGTLWNTTDWESQGYIKVYMEVINAEKGFYTVNTTGRTQTGTSQSGKPIYTYNYENYIMSCDGNLYINVDEEIQRLGEKKGYASVTGQFYSFNENFVINVLDMENSNSGALFAYSDTYEYQNPIELEGNRVGSINTVEGYFLTHQKTYAEDGSISVKIAGLYNQKFEQTAFAGDNDIDCEKSSSLYCSNDKYVFEVYNMDGSISLMDKTGDLEGIYTSVSQLARKISGTPRVMSEVYILACKGNKTDGYLTDVYNKAGIKILSDFEGYAWIDGDENYLLVYKDYRDYSEGYIICDHNGNILMTNEQYGLYDFYAADDGSLLVCVYKTDEDGNKKFGAVKIKSQDIDKDKNGIYIENGEIRYYVNGRVSLDYTGMATDAQTGKRYWFDGGIAARDKQVYDPLSKAWYWFDADGSMAVDKDVYVPESNENRENGKWVRYDEDGHMVKGEDYRYDGWYRFDEITGEMLKGWYTTGDGRTYYYNDVTGQMEHGAVNVNGTNCAFDDVTGVALDNKWYSIDGNEYWYENGIRQGTEGRGKEIYDPESYGWYWLDAIDNGKKAVSKDVYQESYAGQYADRPDGTGKWVRYDENGRMVKGWTSNENGKYYFDPITGAMAKGTVQIDGVWCTFSWETGILQ